MFSLSPYVETSDESKYALMKVIFYFGCQPYVSWFTLLTNVVEAGVESLYETSNLQSKIQFRKFSESLKHFLYKKCAEKIR